MCSLSNVAPAIDCFAGVRLRKEFHALTPSFVRISTASLFAICSSAKMSFEGNIGVPRYPRKQKIGSHLLNIISACSPSAWNFSPIAIIPLFTPSFEMPAFR
jgi:hypothetical protein